MDTGRVVRIEDFKKKFLRVEDVISCLEGIEFFLPRNVQPQSIADRMLMRAFCKKLSDQIYSVTLKANSPEYINISGFLKITQVLLSNIVMNRKNRDTEDFSIRPFNNIGENGLRFLKNLIPLITMVIYNLEKLPEIPEDIQSLRLR